MRLHNRIVKKDFWNDPKLMRWPREKRMLFQGLWCIADDSGCVENDSWAVKVLVFPSPMDSDITPDVIEQFIDEFADEDRIIFYTADGKQCFYIVNFHEHQRIDTPAAPDVPLPEWISWEPYPSNSRAGKYKIGNPYSKTDNQPTDEEENQEELQSSDDVLTPSLQNPSNLNLNLNLNLNNNSCSSNARAKDEPVETVDNVDNLTLPKFIEKEFGHYLSGTHIETIKSWQDIYPDEMIKHALKIAILQDKKSFKYVDGIILDWQKNNIKSMKDVERAEELFRNQKKNKASPRVNNNTNKPGTLNYVRYLDDLVE